MSLSVASNAAGYGKPLGYGLAGWSTVSAGAGTPQQSSAAPSWSYTPTSAGAGRHDARLSDLMAVLSRLSADPDGTATDRSGHGTGDASGSASGPGPGRSDAADLLQALNDTGGAPAVTAQLSPERNFPEPEEQPVQDLAQRPATDAVPAVGPSTQDVSSDPSISAADAQLQALFKTLQEYGL